MDRMSKIFVGLLSAATLPGCGQDSIALEDAQRERLLYRRPPRKRGRSRKIREIRSCWI